MIIIVFFCALAAVGIGIMAYAAINLVKLERTVANVRKRREFSRIETLKEISTTCQVLKNANTDNSAAIKALEATLQYIERYY